MFSSNLTYQLQNWIHSNLFQWFQLIKWKHTKFLWKSRDTYPLLSGFNVEWKIDVVSYLTFYMNNVYNLNPYLTSVFINHISKLYTSQSIKLLSGYHELFGFQSEQHIDWGIYVNNSIKLLVNANNLSMEILFNPWPNNFKLFNYKRNDFFIHNKKFYADNVDNQLTVFNHCTPAITTTTTITLKPFNWFHLNIKKLSNSNYAYSIIQINLIQLNGIFIKFNYSSIITNDYNENIKIINFIIHQLTTFNIQENLQTNYNITQLMIQVNSMKNNLQFIEMKLLNFLENSYYLQINTTQRGQIQAIGYLNQYEILKANGSIEILEDNTTNSFVQIHHPFNTLDIIFHKYINSCSLLQVTSQSDYYPFQLNLINNMPNGKSLNTSIVNAFNISLYMNVFNLLKITWQLHYNSTEDTFLPMYHGQMLFNITHFQDFLSYQTSINWNEISSNKTNPNENDNDKNITIDTKVQSSKFNYTNFQCIINIFKTKAFFTPLYEQPSQFRIYVGFLHLNNNNSNLHEILLITHYERKIQQLEKITTILNSTIVDDKNHLYLNNQLEWKLNDVGDLQKLHSISYIYFKPINQSIKIILLHDINNQLLSSILIESINQYHESVYSIKSWFQPLRNLHEFILQWPNLHTIQIVTIYDFISLNAYISLTLDHLIYFNYHKNLQIKNQLIFKLDEQKLVILHYIKNITTKNTTELITNISSINKNNDILTQFDLIIQLYHNIQLLPLNIQLMYQYKTYLFLSIYKINKNFIGKLKIDLTKTNGDTLFELTTMEYENLHKFNVTFNLNYTFTHRWHSLYYFDGSNMLSIQPTISKYSTSNSLGPGKPLRIKFLYKYNDNYKHGNLMMSLDSQFIGYRLYEGRGTRGYQSELFISQNKNNLQFNILFKIGQPGLIHQNSIEYSHSLQRQHVFIQFSTVYLGNPLIETKLDVQFQNNSLLPNRTNIYLFASWLPLIFIIHEELQVNKSTSITYANVFVSSNKSSIFHYFNQSFLLENKSVQSINMYKYIHLH
ncbi:hypothetical protein EWB00_010000 [Schistosoma japonicum]|uniref:Uncharacterized protein n=1 Tax=Schistosoma japonicum TaxID=6182 RepID=A0A4Z2DQ49_SCHJA|nr:hypothetical protein EWB00_010000 [Schistosoma japonicum]